jgi:hypothetical protein
MIQFGFGSDKGGSKPAAATSGAGSALAARIERNAWLDAQLGALSPEDQNAIARACVLLSNIAGC